MTDLAAAIRQNAIATGAAPAAEGAMLDSFIVVAYWVPEDPDGEGRYTLHRSSDTMPRYAVLGLLDVGVEVLDAPEDDE